MATTLKEIFTANINRLIQDEFDDNASVFASALGVDAGLVSRWRNGETFPEIRYIDRMMETFNWSSSELLVLEKKDAAMSRPPSLSQSLKVVAAHWEELGLAKRKHKTKRPKESTEPTKPFFK